MKGALKQDLVALHGHTYIQQNITLLSQQTTAIKDVAQKPLQLAMKEKEEACSSCAKLLESQLVSSNAAIERLRFESENVLQRFETNLAAKDNQISLLTAQVERLSEVRHDGKNKKGLTTSRSIAPPAAGWLRRGRMSLPKAAGATSQPAIGTGLCDGVNSSAICPEAGMDTADIQQCLGASGAVAAELSAKQGITASVNVERVAAHEAQTAAVETCLESAQQDVTSGNILYRDPCTISALALARSPHKAAAATVAEKTDAAKNLTDCDEAIGKSPVDNQILVSYFCPFCLFLQFSRTD